MVERLKSWESPRKRGRNDKGKGGSARARQLRKREKLLRQKLKQNQEISSKRKQKSQEGEIIPPLFFSYSLAPQRLNLKFVQSQKNS
jgi:hypothetical protein